MRLSLEERLSLDSRRAKLRGADLSVVFTRTGIAREKELMLHGEVFLVSGFSPLSAARLDNECNS